MKKVLIYTTVHPWNDGRIYHRQAQTLKNYYDLTLIGVKAGNDFAPNNVKLLPAWKKLSDRFKNHIIVIKHLIKHTYDAYHFHDPELLYTAPIIKAFYPFAKVVYDVHENYPLIILEKEYIPKLMRKTISFLFIWIEKFFLLFVDLVIYTTDVIGKNYAFGNYKKTRINNLPSIKLIGTNPICADTKKAKAIFMGYIAPLRGVENILAAAKQVHKIRKDFRLIIRGKFFSASYEQSIREIINKNNLDAFVHIEGPYSYTEIPEILKDIKIGLITYLSSPNNMACLPNKLFEYMAAGLNIVASNFDTYSEILAKNGLSSQVVPENNQEIAEAILGFLNNNDLSREMSILARRLYVEKYNWEVEENELIDTYLGLI